MKKRNYTIPLLIVFFLLLIGGIAFLYYYFQIEYIHYIGILGSGLFIAFIVGLIISNTRRKKIDLLEQKLGMWNTITYRVKKAGETAFNKMPLGIIVFNDQLVIEWANKFAQEILSSELIERKIENLSSELKNQIESHSADFTITFYGRVFHCVHLLSDHVLYFYEITHETEVIERYEQRTLCLGILNLDNLDQTMMTLDAQTKALHMSRLIGLLTDWAEKFNICIKGYSEERYLLIMDYQTLQRVIDDNLSIVTTIKEYCEKEELRITLSVGIACEDNTAVDLLSVATEQLNLALSRGGNQAVVKKDGKKLYFGAQGEAFESRTPPIVRAKTEELLSLIEKYSNVFIMAHTQMDTDAFGACIAATKLCDSIKKKSYIVFDEGLVDRTVREIYKNIETVYQDKLSLFIKPSEAASKIKDDSLLLIVDLNNETQLMDLKVYKKAKDIAIIDHHRKVGNAINGKFVHIQPSASSSVELIMEMLSFVDKKKYEITSIEATWMLSGIVIDTNNYMIHTTDRTFSVLSMLQGYGAQMAKAQRYLREDIDSYEKKIDLLNQLEVIDGYGIVLCDDEIYARSFIARIADSIIAINGIKAAFCIGRIEENKVGISARSLDEENVQVIMEKLGGGGHYTTAAVQLYKTKEEAKELLLQVLRGLNDKGETNMKIILIKDVKGKGKQNDVLDIPMGHANYLIRSNQAIEASPENLRQLENKAALQKAQEEKHLEEMKELKVRIETMTVQIKVKVGANGKLFGSVSTKEIVDKFKEQNGIELDKRKIMFDETIDKLGTYKIPIQLHKEVTAIITLYVVEEGNK